MSNITVGSICSGIEAASVAWKNLPFRFEWFSEISDFPSRLLKEKYPFTPNVGDMCSIPSKLKSCEIESPDLICGGTPCQAFSLAGWKKGLEDDRGNLTLKFVDIINQNDRNRQKAGKNSTIVLWENVEGVLRDKTNAFGCFIASLAGFDSDLPSIRWPSAGYVNGPTRNVAWRILDAKFFGLPQQRRRLYVIAGGKDFNPENILFEDGIIDKMPAKKSASLSFMKNGKKFEVFREYTDCLYSAYGTKWNGNAAAYNGSLFVVENSRLRRLTPLECERLMGFPDNYTDIGNAKPTNRYQGAGNSWAVPVINWIGSRICKSKESGSAIDLSDLSVMGSRIYSENSFAIYRADSNCLISKSGNQLRSSESPNESIFGNIQSIIDINAQENVFITPVGCRGILRRSEERGLSINARLKSVLQEISSEWSHAEIEQVSLRQKRGRFSSKAPSSPNEVLEFSI